MSKRLLLLGGGVEQLNALRIAKELGAYVIVFDGAETAPCTFEADEFQQVDIKNRKDLLTAAKAVEAEAIFVHAAELAIEAAAVAAELGLPGINMAVAEAGTDKVTRSKCLKAADVRIPSFIPISRSEEWNTWVEKSEEITFPLIVKPTRMAGAQGVELVPDLHALKAYFDRRYSFSGQDFVLEEYVKGLQLSTESVVVNGQVRSLAIAFRHYDTTQSYLPNQIEDGHSMPWGGLSENESAIKSLTQTAANALGLLDGVIKGDLVQCSNGMFVVLEMAVRTSGGRFCDTVVPCSSGLNILYPLIKMSLGDTIEDDDFSAGLKQGVSQRFLLITPGTKLKKRKEFQRILLQNCVISSWFREDVLALNEAPEIKSHRDRIGYVICVGRDRLEADMRAQSVIKQLSAAIVEEQ